MVGLRSVQLGLAHFVDWRVSGVYPKVDHRAPRTRILDRRNINTLN